MIRRGISFYSFTLGIMALAVLLLPASNAYAVTASDWRAGRIIDDTVFTNAYSMSVGDIQNFLNGKVPACDTYGSKPSELGGVDYDGNGTTTRREYAQYRGYGSNFIFTCLRDYWEVPKTAPGDYIPQSNYGGKPIPAGAKSAAQLIADASIKYNISPKALLIKLATESAGPLTSDDWPFPKQYYYAMGAHCPDSGPNGSANCDANYAGFSIQMDEAASLLRWYLDSMQSSWWTYKRPFQTNSILWNVVERGCGAGDVYIESKATAALYTYTPYQPNNAALQNMYGEGDYCSAYGNRNFWRVWNDWFGPTREGVTISSALNVKGPTNFGAFTNTPTTVSFTLTNESWSAVDVGGMAVAVRDSQGRNYDYPLRQMTVPARSTLKYEEVQALPIESTYTFEIVNFSNGYWNNTYPLSNYSGNQRKSTLDVRHGPTLTAGFVAPVNFRAGLSQAITMTVKNNSASRMDIGKVGIGVRGPNNENMDVGTVSVVLDPGQSQQITMPFRPPYEGKYRMFTVATRDGGASWESNYPFPLSSEIKNYLELTARPQTSTSGGVVSTNTDPREGQNTTLSFKVKNHGDASISLGKIGLWGRDPQNRNIDPGVVPVTLAPGEERQLTFGLPLTSVGKYQFGILSTANNGSSWGSGPEVDTGQSNYLEFTTKDGVVVSGGTEITPTTSYTGGGYAVTFKLKNYKTTSADLGKIGLWGRDPQNRNIDPGVVPVTLAPGEEKQLTFGFAPTISGAYSFGILQTQNNGTTWTEGPSIEAGTVKATRTFTSPITVSKSISMLPASLHRGENGTVSYSLKNSSGANIDLGKIGLWGRDPQNRNIDPGVVPVTLAPGEERQLTFGFTASSEGEYSFGILSTPDNGKTWEGGPTAAAPEVTKSIKRTAKPSTTLTSSPRLSGTAAAGNCGAVEYTVKNFHLTASQDLGKIGLWGRDPQNRNIDPGVVPVTLAPGEERQISFGICFSVQGEYKYGVLATPDNGRTWTNGPAKETEALSNSVIVPVN